MKNATSPDRATILRILDRARWAPSGDNTQPWRFEIVDDDKVVVLGYDTRETILYDLDGHASHMAHGALLETMRIASSAEKLSMLWEASADAELKNIRYEVRFVAEPSLGADPLHEFIETRTVQRRPMRTTRLSVAQKQAIVAAVGPGFDVQIFEAFEDRWKVGRLLWDNAHIRLTCPEAFAVHRSIIEWGARYSKDRIPEMAVGVDPITAKVMHWVMKSWGRVDFFNKYLMGTILPRIQLDLVPALRCAAHLLVLPKRPPASLQDWVLLGGAMQRLWLATTQAGLCLQPEMTPVIFRWYAKADRQFSADRRFLEKARRLAMRFEEIAGRGADDAFGFFCRVGYSGVVSSRSVRLSLDELMAS